MKVVGLVLSVLLAAAASAEYDYTRTDVREAAAEVVKVSPEAQPFVLEAAIIIDDARRSGLTHPEFIASKLISSFGERLYTIPGLSDFFNVLVRKLRFLCSTSDGPADYDSLLHTLILELKAGADGVK